MPPLTTIPLASQNYAITRTYNPQDGRGSRKPATQEQAMSELVEVVKALKPDKFTPTIIKQTDDFLYVEYQSPTFGVSHQHDCRAQPLTGAFAHA